MEYVAYYRVSTENRSKELSTQKKAVKEHLKDWWPPQSDFIETETGNPGQNRPELKRAVAYCKYRRASLIVAKLGLLYRDLTFIESLQNNIDLACCDMPEVNKETISFMVALVRWEKKQLAERTKKALGIKKKQGACLGANHPKVQAGLMKWRQKQVLKRVNKAKEKKSRKPTKRELADKRILQSLKILIKEGYSYKKIAYAFNLANTPTRQGTRWTAVQIFRVVKRNNLR